MYNGSSLPMPIGVSWSGFPHCGNGWPRVACTCLSVPYTARTFKGSVLATLLAAILFLIAYAVWEAANYTARSVQRTAFMTIETTAATSRLVTEKAGQAVEALFPKPAPVTEASLESILPPGSHLGNQMKDAIRQNTLPYQEGSGTLTDAARQIDSPCSRPYCGSSSTRGASSS